MLCWLLGKEADKLSSDRLERVKNSYANYSKKFTKSKVIKVGKKYALKRKRLMNFFPKY